MQSHRQSISCDNPLDRTFDGRNKSGIVSGRNTQKKRDAGGSGVNVAEKNTEKKNEKGRVHIGRCVIHNGHNNV